MLYSDISPRTAAYADLKLLERSTLNNILGRWGQNRTLPTKKSQTVKFRRYTKLDKTPVILAEGVTPAGKTLAVTDIPCILYQFGDWVRYTDVIEDTHEDPVLNETKDLLGDQADEMLDTMRFGVLKAGTNVLYTNGTQRTDVYSVISSDLIRSAVRILEKQEARKQTQMISGGAKINTHPIPDCYIAVCATDLTPDIERCTGFKSPSEYASSMGVIPGEIGSVGKVRFIGDNNCVAWANGGGNYNGGGYDTLTTAGAKSDVYPILILGKDAYGVVNLAGKNAIQTLIANPKAQVGDELAQKGSMGWKGWNGCAILNDLWMLRIECAAKG
jgi:N4-gp56 family major capsid protein